jgi:hypothetical protein
MAQVLYQGEVSEWLKVLDSKSSVARATGGSNPPLSATAIVDPGVRLRAVEFGEVTEWSKVHDWKSCVSQGTEGSNPSLSAKDPRASVRDGTFSSTPVSTARHQVYGLR